MRKNRVGKRQPNFGSWASLAFGLLALVALSTSALAQENTAESWYKSGQELERTGAWQEAIDAYDQAIKLNPEYEEAWCAKCKALSNKNLELSGEGQDTTFDDTVNACNKAIEIDPKNARSWSSKGFVLSQEAMLTANKSKYNDSLLAYEKAIEVADSDTSALAEAWRGKGTVLSRMGRSDEALAAQEKAIELNGSDVEAWMGKAMALSKLGRNEESVQSFDKIIQLYPSEDQRIFDYPYIWYSKGRVLEKLGRDEEAAHAYNRSIDDVDTIIDWVASGRDFYMNLSEAWQYKGQLLEEQGRYKEAVQALENATRINPESQSDWCELGTVLARDLGRYNQSLEAYDRALQLDPMDGDILTGKANVLRSLGRYDEALEHYEKVLQLDMQSPHSFFHLAKAWLGKGEILRIQDRYNESFLAYDKALELDPRYPEDVWIGRGRLLDSMGRHREAQKEYDQSFVSYREVAKNNSRRCDIWHGLGNALLGLKRYEEALNAYDNATLLNPNYAEAWFDKGLALWALNRDAEADAAFARARTVGYSAEPQFLQVPPVVTNVTSLGDDEFIELANNENVAQGFRNLRLIVDGDENKSIIIPNFSLEPGQKIRIHFGQGESNQTDLYLSSEIDLNDTAGNLTLRDSIRDIVKGYMEYWTPPAQENSAEYWLKIGNEAAGNGSFEESLQDFGKAIQIDAQNAEAWRGKGNVQKVLGQNDEGNQSLEKSLSLYDEIIKANPGDTNARFNKSMVLTALGRPNEALNVLDNIIELDPKNYGALGRKAEVLSIIGMYNESINTFDKALQMIPASATETLFSLWMAKGWTLLAHSDNDAALTAFEKGITLNPLDGSAWFFKGDALKALGRQSEAIEAYAKASELGYSNSVPAHENTAEDWFNKGQELFRNGSKEEAVGAYDKAIELDPENTEAWLGKGTVLGLWAGSINDKSLYEDAIKAFDKAIELDPQQTRGRLVKASALLNLGRYNESLKTLDEAIEAASQDTEKAQIWFEKAHLFAEQGNYNETAKALEKASLLDPKDKDLWINGGVLLSAHLGRYDEALKYYERGLQIDPPTDGYAWYAKGEALKSLGRNSEADAAFVKAKELGYQE